MKKLLNYLLIPALLIVAWYAFTPQVSGVSTEFNRMYWDVVDDTFKVAVYSVDENRLKTLVRLSDQGLWVNSEGKLSVGKNTDGSAASWHDKDALGKPVIRFGPEEHVGVNSKFKQVLTQEVIINSGASLFTTSEEGVPLHVTFRKVGNAYQMNIAEMTDIELSSRGLHRGEFKGKP